MSKTIETVTRRRGSADAASVDADICVLGSGISGTAAAIEAARLGRRVVLADAGPQLGGQAVGSIIGTVIGLFSHGKHAYQITHALADELIAEFTEALEGRKQASRWAPLRRSLNLAGDRPVHAVKMAELQRRLHDNLERTD